MIPSSVTMIPQFLLYKSFGLIDTYVPLILPAYVGYPIWIFLIRQFFMTVPFEYDDAAKIDGCGYLATYWRILLPQIRPALIAVAIFSFMSHWNNFMGPLIYLQDEAKYTLALGLQMYRSTNYVEWPLLMAAATIVVIPTIIAFYFTQNTIVESVTLTGLKG